MTAIAYGPGLAGGFVFDDYPNILLNEALQVSGISASALLNAALSSDAGPFARPLSMLSLAVQVAYTGFAPYPLKLANVAIHLGNGTLIFFLSRAVLQALGDRLVSASPWMGAVFPPAVAAAWLLAPINLTAVLYLVQRMESLSTLFVLIGLLAYLHGRMQLVGGRQAGLAWMAGGLVGFTILAALAKETGVLLPAYAFVLEWVLFGFCFKADAAYDDRVVALFAVVLIAPGLLGILSTLPQAVTGESYAGRQFDLGERLLTELRVVVDYLKWIMLPDLGELGLYHDDYLVSHDWLSPVSTLLSALLLAALLALAVWLKARRPLVSLGLFLFFVGHSLVSTYLPLELIYEHRNYLPSFGLFLAFFSLLLLEPRHGVWRVGGLALTSGLILLAAFITTLRAGEWASPGRLVYIEATRHPASPRANYELGRVFGEQAQDINGPAFAMAVKSFEVAAGLPNSGLLPLQGLVFVKSRLGGEIEPALWARMKAAIESGPLARQDVTALHSLIICRSQGVCTFQAALLGEVLELAVQRNPTLADLQTLYANYAINVIGDSASGLRLMSRAVALAPQNPQYWANLISLQIALGMFAEARTGLRYLGELNRFGNLNQTIAKLEAILPSDGAVGGHLGISEHVSG